MSDEENPEFEIHDISELPGPIKAIVDTIRKEIGRVEMHSELMQHDFHNLVHSLTEEQLGLMVEFTKVIQSSPDKAANYYIGYFVSLAETKYGRCSSCGTNHDEQLRDIADNG